ncbi:hypothetical protein AURDEDRAFT_163851 [Auricularia subglabra TFB-10046 SS5]|nr:hypothetical protein AURDEDRAFT_163851 [Auricularia subglabra TFB-10046 SS5]
MQQISTEDKNDDSYIDVMPLLQSLLRTTAIADRFVSIHRILDCMKIYKHPPDLEHPHLMPILDACFRGTSHTAAVDAILSRTDLSPSDLKSLLRRVVRMRFRQVPFMPVSDFKSFLRHWESCGHEVHASVLTTNGRGHIDLRLYLEAQLLELEKFVLDRYPACANDFFYSALLDCTGVAFSQSRKPLFRMFSRLWGIIKEKQRPLTTKSLSVALHVAPEHVDAVWADHIASGASSNVWAWTASSRALLRLGRRGEAFDIVNKHIGDDLENTDAALALFAFAKSEAELGRYSSALPRTWASPKSSFFPQAQTASLAP